MIVSHRYATATVVCSGPLIAVLILYIVSRQSDSKNMTGWSIGLLADWLVGWLAGWLVGRSVGRSVGVTLVGLLVGFLIDCVSDF